MARLHPSNVRETASNKPASGATAFTLPDSATAPYRSFDTALATGDTVPVHATNGTDWQDFIGTFTAGAPDTLAQTTLLESSTGSFIDWSAGGDVTLEVAWLGKLAERVEAAPRDPVSVTGTTTLTTAALGKLHICSGTSADYTVTLPTAASCANESISFAMAAGLTKLVTIDANGTETIDGALTRMMYANETATLFSDGTTWIKTAGKTLPIAAQMSRDAAQSISDVTVTKILFDAIVFNAAGCADATTNDRFDIKRSGKYLVSGSWYLNVGSGFLQSRIHVDAAEVKTAVLPQANAGLPIISETFDLTAGSYVELHVYHQSGSAQNTATASATRPRMTITEIPSW